jgi:protein-L-isoaspartate(D-aspartate) O-methyltransferase
MLREKGLRHMLAGIESEVTLTHSLIGKKALDERVMYAMGKVPRDEFVPGHLKPMAFENGPLSIGEGQTISQPYMVALMTDLLQVQPHHKVLEVGTGSGYQGAVLSLLCEHVYSIERLPELAGRAAQRLHTLGYDNVSVRCGDGYAGWPEYAPYDAIVVTAAAPYIPEALVAQLKPEGRLVIPVGMPYAHQQLMLLCKDASGDTRVQSILDVAFVPLVEEGEGGECE